MNLLRVGALLRSTRILPQAGRMKSWEIAARLTAIGWYVAASVVIPTLIGKWVDGRYGSGRLWTLIGFAFGTFIAGYGVFEMLRALVSRAKQNNQTRNKE